MTEGTKDRKIGNTILKGDIMIHYRYPHNAL